MPFQHALKLMHERRLRRLPVTDTEGKLVGIVAERDLLYASASPATSLSVWELNYLLSKLKIRELMTKEVIGSEFHSRESYRFIPKAVLLALPLSTLSTDWNTPADS